jgi:Fe-S oxidoreductase
MIKVGSLELKDYMYDMRRCMRCASCRWVDHIYMPDNRFVYRCPSYARYYFSKVAYGRLKLGLALVEERLFDTPGMMDMVFQCTMCGACDSGCKRNLDLEILNALEALRGWMVERGRFPEEHRRIIENVTEKNNRFGAPHRDRNKKLSSPDPGADTVFFQGCGAAYLETGITEATGKILGFLGGFRLLPDEVCCGHPLFAMGHYDAFRKQMDKNYQAMLNTGVKRLVTACAECYKTWKVDYPRLMGMNTVDMPFKVLHITEVVDEALKEGRLSFHGSAPIKVAWHDPCNLGRMSEPWINWQGERGQWGCLVPDQGFEPKQFRRGTSGVYNEPRRILSALPGVEWLELKRHHEFSYCCGNHGGVAESYPDMFRHTVNHRLDEVLEIGAEAVVSACPYCQQAFSSALAQRDLPLKVYDITELVSQVL